jgi:hypothetical protein
VSVALVVAQTRLFVSMRWEIFGTS